MKNLFQIALLTFICIFLSCSHSKRTKLGNATGNKSTIATNAVNNAGYLYKKNDSLCIVNGVKHFCMPDDTNIAYKRPYDGIYEIIKGRSKRSYNKLLNGRLYFTTYEDLGMGYRGYLFVMDVAKKTLIRDPNFKYNYLYSVGGIFIIDTTANKIFSIGKPEWYDRRNSAIVAASMYKLDGGHFKFLKNVYEFSTERLNDTTVAAYFNRLLTNNANKGMLLPDDWWKVK